MASLIDHRHREAPVVDNPAADAATAGPRAVDAVIAARYANRFFLDRPVGRETLRDILDIARFAPSGANIQPWRVYVVAGEARRRLSRAMVRAHEAGGDGHAAEYEYYPADFPEPYRLRRDSFGATYYGALGIDRKDHGARHRQTGRNFEFFGAPVGLIFTIDRRLGIGSWLDYGTFLQNIMISAKARGLDSCPQETLAKYHRIIRQHLPIDPLELVICGMSLGYADRQAASLRGVQARAPVEAFAQFLGFDDDGSGERLPDKD